MNNGRKHITIVLLVLFLAPQANNALHYFWLQHHFGKINHNKIYVSKKHEVHNCDTSLFKLPAATTVPGVVLNFILKSVFCLVASYYKAVHYKIAKEVHRLRGPPLNHHLHNF